jgi:hypothetical protein
MIQTVVAAHEQLKPASGATFFQRETKTQQRTCFVDSAAFFSFSLKGTKNSMYGVRKFHEDV